MTSKGSQIASQQEPPVNTTPSLQELCKTAAPPSTSNFSDWCSTRVVSLPTHMTPCNRMPLKSNLSSEQSRENLPWQKPYCFQAQQQLHFHSYKKTRFHLRSQIALQTTSESSQTKLQRINDPFKSLKELNIPDTGKGRVFQITVVPLEAMGGKLLTDFSSP